MCTVPAVVEHVKFRVKPVVDLVQYCLHDAPIVTWSFLSIPLVAQLLQVDRNSAGEKQCWTVNLAAVLSQMSTGGGLTRLNSTLVLLDVPGMHKQTYLAMEEFLGDTMKQQLIHTMTEAAEAERQHAVATNDYCQGVLTITVLVDGRLSKCSHKHSYNAKSELP